MTVLVWNPVPVGLRGVSYGGTNAEVAAWIDDFFSQLETLDITQTADTGQYVYGGEGKAFLAVGDNVSLAYRIYRLDDIHASTHPIFFKVDVLRAWMANTMRGGYVGIRITAGTSTDGLGGFVGKTLTTYFTLYSSSGNSYMQVRGLSSNTSYASSVGNKGFFGVSFNGGAHAGFYWGGDSTWSTTKEYADTAFFIERVPNSDGTPSTAGFTLFGINETKVFDTDVQTAYNSRNSSIMVSETYMYSSDLVYRNTAGIPYFAQTTLTNDYIVNHFYHSTPNPVRSNGLCGVRADAFGAGAQFECLVYGDSPSSFLIPPKANLRCAYNALDFAFLFE